jgi:hypothetical protein
MRPPMLIGLTVALALTAWMALQDDDSAVEPVRSAQKKTSGQARAPGKEKVDVVQTQLLVQSVAHWQSRPALPPLPRDAARPWASQQPPPPPQPASMVAVEPPAPMAPPFPHAWVGRFDDDAKHAIVSSLDATWVVAVGDVIDGQWRIDQIQDRQMSLTYLPLKQRQTVAMKAP